MMQRTKYRARQIINSSSMAVAMIASLAFGPAISFAQTNAQPIAQSNAQPIAQSNAPQRNIPRDQTNPAALQFNGQVEQPIRKVQLDQVAGENPQQAAVQQVAAVGQPQRPFPPLAAAANARLQQLLNAWEQQSKATKTLTCKFEKWHYDLQAAPAGIHATKSAGVIKYAAPDQGLFREEAPMFYNGMVEGKPSYKTHPNRQGDYWVCNGREVIEFDATEKKCTVTTLPPGMTGQQIFNSPLPFVFNLDAKQIQQRYWVREVKAPKPGIYLIEAWPKNQQDRAQYRLVQIALDDKQFLPHALIMYAPNFNAKTAPVWDHYQFESVSQNGFLDNLQKFMQNFVPKRPPSDWEIVRETMPAGGFEPQRQAQAPAANGNIK